MRPRLTTAWMVLVFTLAALLPATTLAYTPYRAIKLDASCSGQGGAHGYGYIYLAAKAKEVGKSGTNYFVIKSKLQYSTGVSWTTWLRWPNEISSKFPNDSTNYYRVVKRRYDFRKGDNYGYRLVIKVQFWSNSHGLLAARTVKTACY